MIRPLILMLVMASLALAPCVVRCEEKFTFAGKLLSDGLKQLQSRGLKIVFSETVVLPSMKVKKEPESKDLRKILDEILRPHELKAESGPAGNLIIVRDTRKDKSSKETEETLRIVLDEIVVTPGSYSLLGSQTGPRQFLTQEEIGRIPHLSNDFYRVLARLPGTASGDFSAELNLRGGEQDEVLVLVDGMEIPEPFHLTDFQSLFSILDSDAIGGVDFLTGGFPVEYRNRMSGVIDISTATTTGSMKTIVGASLLNLHFLNGGNFSQNRGSWLVSARRGYLDIVLPLVDPESGFDPTYYDFLGKLQYQVNDRHLLGFHFLGSRDDLQFEDDDTEQVDASATNLYGWIDFQSAWTSSLFSQTIVSIDHTERERRGGVTDLPDFFSRVDDERRSIRYGVKQAWTLESHPRNQLKWGFEFAHAGADYKYRGLSIFNDPILNDLGVPPRTERNIRTSPSGYDTGIYLADRFLISDSLAAELGLRWDRQTFTDDDDLSPRFNLAYQLSNSTIRAGWGRFYQGQRITELQVEDGVDHFFPAQVAEHRLAGMDHRFQNEMDLRIEVYQKKFTSLRPRFENLFDPVELFPEAESDRIEIIPDEAEAKGIEFVLKKSAPRFSWWASYALSSVQDKIDDDWVARSWDQRHSASFSLNFKPSEKWNLNLAGVYRSGRPTTALTATRIEDTTGNLVLHPVLGPRNAERLSGYQRLDLRVSRTVPLSRGTFTFFLEVTNILNRKNVARIEDFDFIVLPDGSVRVEPDESYGLPWLPSFGVTWEF